MLLQSLDVFIGIVTTFLLLSLIASAIGEGFSTWTNLKGRVVGKLVKQLLGEADAAKFMQHPAIKRLQQPNGRSPSYIPDHVFASTLLQFLVNGHEQEGPKPIAANTIDAALRQPVVEASDTSWSMVVRGLWQDAQFDVAELEKRIAAWFNQSGDRSTGWFRRELSLYLFGIGLVTAIFLDADTLRMFEKLSTDQNLRQMYVEQATQMVAAQAASDAKQADATKLMCSAFDVASSDCKPDVALKRTLAEITPLVGFDLYASELSREKKCPDCWIGGVSLWFWVLKATGLFLTAAAVSLGAPFWFDMLQKVVQIRSSVRPAITTSSGQTVSTGAVPDAQPPIARAPIRPIAAAPDALADLSRFETTRLGFSAINYAWSARLAKLAYERNKDAVASQLQSWGAGGELVEDKSTDTQCIVASTPTAAFVAFRGTEQRIEDWLTDLEVKLEGPSWDTGARYRVHQGFNRALGAVATQLIDALESRGVFSRHLPIWITGHSLGGALAALCGLRLLQELASRPQSTTIGALFTFGQPRVGDKACAAALDQSLASRYFRSVNHRDVVPRVPLTSTPDLLSKVTRGGALEVYDYAHAGRVVYFDDTGQAMMDPPLWYKTLDALPVALSTDEIKKAITAGVGDHNMDNYVRLHCAMVGA